MDANTRFLLREFKRELSNLEKRIEADFIEMKTDVKEIKVSVQDLTYFKAKVIGGSAILSFLVTIAISIIFN